jgi:transcriptional regulator with XRE-family HTH domain
MPKKPRPNQDLPVPPIWLAEWREAAGLKQRELADKLVANGVQTTEASISRMEASESLRATGKPPQPLNPRFYWPLSKILKTHPAVLMIGPPNDPIARIVSLLWRAPPELRIGAVSTLEGFLRLHGVEIDGPAPTKPRRRQAEKIHREAKP